MPSKYNTLTITVEVTLYVRSCNGCVTAVYLPCSPGWGMGGGVSARGRECPGGVSAPGRGGPRGVSARGRRWCNGVSPG